MPVAYDEDVVAWADEQAAMIRAGRFDQLDLEHLADEIQDVGRSERRELANRMAVLLAHLLEWQFQPERRGASWELTIGEQRRRIARAIERTPSLRAMLSDPEWIEDVWTDGVAEIMRETNIDRLALPLACPWATCCGMPGCQPDQPTWVPLHHGPPIHRTRCRGRNDDQTVRPSLMRYSLDQAAPAPGR